MSAPDRNSFADVWDQLDPKFAERVRVTDAATIGDEEIVRRWPQIGEGYLSKCVTALSLFTDSSNSRPQLWVKDPVVGREVFPGIYRSVTVDVDVQKPGLKGIIQTLRKGFNTAANWNEARLSEFEQGPANSVSVAGVSVASDNPTKILRVVFPNCSPDHARAIAVSLATASHSDVVVRGETYTGAWNSIWAASKIEEDGSATITLFLALAQYNLVAYSDFATERQQDVVYLYDVPKPTAQNIIDAWKNVHPVGSSATSNYSRTSGFVDLTLRAKSGDAIEHDFGDVGEDCRYVESQIAIFGTEVESSYPIPAIIDGIGISYKRDVRSNGDGTFDVFLTKKEAKYRNATGLVIEQSAAETTTQQQQLGITTQPLADMGEEVGKIKTQRVEIRDDCSKDAVTNVSVGKELVSTEKTEGRSFVDTTTTKTFQSSPVADPVFETGKIKTAKNEPSRYFGKYDTTERTRELKEIPAAVVYDSNDDASEHSRVEKDINIKNPGGVAVVLDASAGEVLSARVEYDEETDTLDVSKTVSTGKEQVDVEISVSAGAEETVTKKTVQASALPPPVQVDGQIKRVSSSASKYADKVDTTESVKTVKLLSAVAAGGTVLVNERIEVDENADSDNSGVLAGTEGTTVDSSSNKNEAGRFNNRKTIRTSKPFGPKTDVHGTPLIEETVHLFENTPLPSPGVPADGTTDDVSARINQDGSTSFARTIRRGIARIFGAFLTNHDEFETENTTIKVHQDSVSETRGANESLKVSVEVDEFGKLNSRVLRESPTPQISDVFLSEADGYKRVEKTKYRNASTIPVATGKGERVDAERNKFGKYDAVKTVVSATEFYIDYNVPAASGRSPSFSRLYFGIEDSATIQARIQEFFATVNAVTNEQYTFSCGVGRDGDGFYNLEMHAKPKQAGGSASDWDDGFNFTMPSMKPASAYATTSAVITYTSNRIKVQSLLTPTPELTNACYSGAGGGTSVLFLGRGRYKVTITTGTGTP